MLLSEKKDCKKMDIGVKFCGGCNPMYDRGKLYKRIIEAYPEHSFETADETKNYKTLLAICGCERACVNTDSYKKEKEIRIFQDMVPEI